MPSLFSIILSLFSIVLPRVARLFTFSPMTCNGNNATPPSPAIAPGADSLDVARFARELAARWPGGVDPRIRAIVPTMDAPFFQAGLAGYSDAAMRIVARQQGCPLCVTEALLDRMLLGGGRGFNKADLALQDEHLIADNLPSGADDHPLIGQLIGSDPDEMAAAALKMYEQGQRHDRTYRDMAYGQGGMPQYVDTRWKVEQNGTAVQTKLKADGVPSEPNSWDSNDDCRSGCEDDDCTPASLRSLEALEAMEALVIPEQYDPRMVFAADSDTGQQDRPEHALRHKPATVTTDERSRSFASIDVNLACPVKKIDRKSRGGHWLTEPEGALDILKAVRAALPQHVPVTVKLRRAYDDTPEMARNFEKIFNGAYELGYSWATVHARTVEQRYIGPSRWEFLRDLCARNTDKVVFGSGDIWFAADIFRMIAYTGVGGVSVARGCIGNPWIFRQARQMLAGQDPTWPTVAEQREVLLQHFRLSVAVNGERNAGKLMRKFGIKFAQHHPNPEAVKKRMCEVSTTADWLATLEELYGAGAGG